MTFQSANWPQLITLCSSQAKIKKIRIYSVKVTWQTSGSPRTVSVTCLLRSVSLLSLSTLSITHVSLIHTYHAPSKNEEKLMLSVCTELLSFTELSTTVEGGAIWAGQVSFFPDFSTFLISDLILNCREPPLFSVQQAIILKLIILINNTLLFSVSTCLWLWQKLGIMGKNSHPKTIHLPLPYINVIKLPFPLQRYIRKDLKDCYMTTLISNMVSEVIGQHRNWSWRIIIKSC